ncbi:uncharacterized protein [Dendrobates tinctorius]|uniref:uncharacterized protein n=1 Tax=Dendrobates tinctorius TaxID=92724 RepID=UPI003CC973A9
MAARYSRLGSSEKRTSWRKSHLQIPNLQIWLSGILGLACLDSIGAWTPGICLTTKFRKEYVPRPGDWKEYNRTTPNENAGCGGWGKLTTQVIFDVNLTITAKYPRPWYYNGTKSTIYLADSKDTLNIQAEDHIICWTTEQLTFDQSIWDNYSSKGENKTEFTFTLNKTMIIFCGNATNRQMVAMTGQKYPPCNNHTGTYNGTGLCCGIPSLSCVSWRRILRVYLMSQTKADPGQMKKIPTSCVKTGTQSQKTVVAAKIIFPPTPACHYRGKRAWYDTVLGGVGAVTVTLNSFDIETLANKMHNAGKDIQDALTIQGRWMPTIWRPWKQALQMDTFLLQMKNVSDTLNLEINTNVSIIVNWTICTLQAIYQIQQKNNMQTQLMTGNELVWRTVFKNTIPKVSWLRIEAPKMLCNDTLCSGLLIVYNVTNQQVMCRFVVMPLLLGIPGQQWLWMPKFNGLYIDKNNRTHDLSLCEDTLEGKICRLQSAVYEPCLLQNTMNVCEFIILPTSYRMLIEIAPQEVCVITDVPIISGMIVPYVGCLRNVTALQWENRTFLLSSDVTTAATIEWEPTTLEINNWEVNLMKLKHIIEQSEVLN